MKLILKSLVIFIFAVVALVLGFGVLEPVNYPTGYSTELEYEMAAKKMFLIRFYVGVLVTLSALMFSSLLKVSYFISILISVITGPLFFYSKVCFRYSYLEGCKFDGYFDYLLGSFCTFIAVLFFYNLCIYLRKLKN